MNRRFARVVGVRKSEDIIEIRIKDFAKNTYFKKRAYVTDKKEIKRIFDSLRHFGVNVKEIVNVEEKKKPQKKKEDFWW